MIRATAADGQIRAFAVTARAAVDYARKQHGMSPECSAALGRLMMGGLMMGMMMKDDRDLLTLQVIGDGPMKSVTVTADRNGHVKGFCGNAGASVPEKHKGKLDVGTAVGQGILRVMKDTGGKEPYIGTVALVSGEIAEDLTYYFAQSEQTPSVVGLGVLVDTDLSVKEAGGFIVQLMPDASDETIARLEETIQGLLPVTTMLSEGKDPGEMLGEVLNGLSMKVLEEKTVSFSCDCGKERITSSLSVIAKEELSDMIENAEPIEVRCQFCSKKYIFSIEELKKILEKGKKT